MGKIVSTSGNNGKGDKSIFYKKRRNSTAKRSRKRRRSTKGQLKKQRKFLLTGKKVVNLTSSVRHLRTKDTKQLEDDDVDMKKDVDMDERENSSDAEFEESGAENMSDMSDADDNNVETDVDNADNADDADDPMDVEEPEIEDRGKMFTGKKRPKTGQAGRKSTDFKRKNYAEPEPSLSKVDSINLPRKKQEELFRPCHWDVSKPVKT